MKTIFRISIFFISNLEMNFSFKSKTINNKKTISPFGIVEDEKSDLGDTITLEPLDYLRIKAVADRRDTGADSGTSSNAVVSLEETIRQDREAALRRRDETMNKKSSSDGFGLLNSSSSVNLNQSGLVILDTSKDPTMKGASKHISKMVETSQVNDKFKNLLKMKIAERDKDKAEIEFGTRPEEFITGAYLKQKEENVRLEQELELRESSEKKRNVSNLFRDMLSSGSYARSNYVGEEKPVATSVSSAILSKVVKDDENTKSVPSKELVEKVLAKIVPESAEEVSRVIHQQAINEAKRIVDQLDKLVTNEEEGGEEERVDARQSAKERYLERKRRKLEDERGNDE